MKNQKTFLVLCYTTARGRITFVKVAMETKKKDSTLNFNGKWTARALQTTIVLTWLSSLTTSSIIRKAFQKIPSYDPTTKGRAKLPWKSRQQEINLMLLPC